MTDWHSAQALIVVDVQRGFEDPGWGRRDNLDCEANIGLLLAAWRARGWPIVFVRHDSASPGSPLSADAPGNAFKPIIDGRPDLLVVKHTNSAFYGRPDLHGWLQRHAIRRVAICGITTNHCCETTARMAGNLGYDTTFVLDATHTFDRRDLNGRWVPAEELSRITAANLNEEFATVQSTTQTLATLAT